MIEEILELGDEIAVTVFKNRESIGAVILTRTDEVMVECDIYCDGYDERASMMAALDQVRVALDFTMHKASIGEAIKRKIAEMTENREGREEEPPYPADDIRDIPF
jgi:hypothetical protein